MFQEPVEPTWLLLLRAARELVVTIAAATGAYVAWKGLDTWKRSLRGGAEYEQARRLVRATYKLRDEAYRVRHPFTVDVPDHGDLDPDTYKLVATTRTLTERLKAFDERMKEFEEAAVDAEVLWGDPAKQAIGDVREMRVRLHSLIGNYVAEANDLWEVDAELPDPPTASPDADDELWTELSAAVKSIEDLLNTE